MGRRQLTLQRYTRLSTERNAFFDALAVDFKPEKLPRIADLKVLSFGSCFALNIHKALSDRGVKSTVVGFSEEVNSPFMNDVYINQLIHGGSSKYHDIYRQLTDHEWHIDGVDKDRVLAVLKDANVIVFTVGLAQIWSEKATGKPVLLPNFEELDSYTTRFLYPKPQSEFIIDMVEAIRTVNEAAQIMLTLSPVPLQTSLSAGSVAQADCISKSILRVAIQFAMERELSRVHYFPSFEFFRWYSGHTSELFFGVDGKIRHPSQEMIDFVLSKFLERVAVESVAVR